MRKIQLITSAAHALAIVALASTLAGAACGERTGAASADAARAKALPNSEGETELGAARSRSLQVVL